MKTSTFFALLSAALLGVTLARAADGQTSGVPATYPLSECPISGKKLGEMGKPFKVTSEGTDVYLCCKGCLKDFNKDPAKYVKGVKDAEAKK